MADNLSYREQIDHSTDSNSAAEVTDTFTADNQRVSIDQPPPKKKSKVLLPVSCRDDIPPDEDDYDEKRMDIKKSSHIFKVVFNVAIPNSYSYSYVAS